MLVKGHNTNNTQCVIQKSEIIISSSFVPYYHFVICVHFFIGDV